jgi:hypothetical protein
MKYEIRNRYTGNVQFTAEIDCEEDAPRSTKVGLAAKWAIKNGADMSGADMSYADMRDAVMSGADMSYADMRHAVMRDADMSGANMRRADMRRADMRRAVMRDADMRGAVMSGADMRGADMRRAVGQGSEQMVCLQVNPWRIVMTPDVMAIGCEQHPVVEWWQFDDRRINQMDAGALRWWRRWKPILQQVHAASFKT